MNKWIFWVVGALFTVFLATITFTTNSNDSVPASKEDILQEKIRYMSPINQQMTNEFLLMKRDIMNKTQVYKDTHTK